MSSYGYYPEYETVAQKKARAQKLVKKLQKQGKTLHPVDIEGRRNITHTFWGKSWCKHLESYIEYENRLPRGRSYVRHGAIVDLVVDRGSIKAQVAGSHGAIYQVHGKVKKLESKRWEVLKQACSGKIGSLIDLLEGKLSDVVMEVVTDRDKGLFPSPEAISLDCDCPDWVDMCKHNAAVLYGIGVRFDEDPSLLFKLRCVDHEELLGSDQLLENLGTSEAGAELEEDSLSDIFGIEMETLEEPAVTEQPSKAAKKAPAKKAPAKKARRAL